MSAEVATPLWSHQFARVVTGSPELVARNNHLLVAFDAAAVETIEFDLYIGLNYASGSNATCTVTGVFASATSNTARIRLEFEYIAAGAMDIDADSFATAVEANTTADSVSGESSAATFTLSNANMDLCVAGSWCRVRVSRVGNDGTNDTATGDWQFKLLTITQ